MNDDTLCSQCVITDCKNNCPHGVIGEAPQNTSPLDDMVSRKEYLHVVEAAYYWWLGLRPVGWTEQQHLDQWQVNTRNDYEKNLARSVAATIS